VPKLFLPNPQAIANGNEKLKKVQFLVSNPDLHDPDRIASQRAPSMRTMWNCFHSKSWDE
jgi:hypothetical protein